MILLVAASALSGLPPSEAVLKVYDMACNGGELHLDASEARVVSPDNSAVSFPLAEWGSPRKLTSIYLTYPSGTGIQIAIYDAKYPQQIASACIVWSKSISRADAVRGLLSGVHNAEITSDPNSPLEIDRPKEGYRKRLMFEANSGVVMETDLYKAPH